MCAPLVSNGAKVWIFDPFYEVKAPELQHLRVSYQSALGARILESPTLIDEALACIAESIRALGESADNAYFSDIARSICEAPSFCTL